MKKDQLISFAKSLDIESITFHLQTNFGKWYEQKFTSEFNDIKLQHSYGVSINSNDIDFIFKVGKKEDNILKTFVTQYINKYAVKNNPTLEDGVIVYPKKEAVLNDLKNNNRVTKSFFYTTLYGIGWFCFFSSNKSFLETNNLLEIYLKKEGVKFTNEFSEAGWVYRFVINKDIEVHNNLLNKLEL